MFTSDLPRKAQAPISLDPARVSVVQRPGPGTEYERLATAFERVLRRQDAFMETAQIFADALTDCFADYLKCPRGAIVFQPEDVDIREVGLKRFILEQAVKLRKDGWFGFRITLQVSSLRHISFPLSFKRASDSSWAVRLTRTAEQFEVSDSLDGAEVAFRAWVDLAASGFEAMLENILRFDEHGAGVEFGLNARRD